MTPLMYVPVQAISYGLDIRHLIRCIVNNVIGQVVLCAEEGVVSNRVFILRNINTSCLDLK
jgi:hypothetical protein